MREFLSRRERKGPTPQAWEGEGFRPQRMIPSSSRLTAGPSFSLWETVSA